ncbi:hypothetical protein GCM10010109_47100 [Actinoplanes campanulatus]|nr:hypothetical protein GCM10010109_47100 [Actinoplanes campanulatus]GID39014.1 hypothetical protein Aca09nite_55200 [Actinoplanes campanulatus]
MKARRRSVHRLPFTPEAKLPTIEVRVTRLEKRMDEVERLRASQDRDLSDVVEKLRAQDSLLQALAETQAEHTATFARHTATLDQHTEQLTRIEARFDGLEARFGGLESGVQEIIGMLETLIGRENLN